MSSAPAIPSGPVQLALVVDNDADHAAAPHAAFDSVAPHAAPPSWGHALLERHLDELVATARDSGLAFYDRSDAEGELIRALEAALERALRSDPEAAAALGSSKLATERACVAALLLEDVRAGDVPDDFERRLFAPLGIDPSAWVAPAELADDARDETRDHDEEPRDTHEAHAADNAPEAT